jgi:hypothetical protein
MADCYYYDSHSRLGPNGRQQWPIAITTTEVAVLGQQCRQQWPIAITMTAIAVLGQQ